jgi:uncharacterized damage-inducible protein DinB
MTYRKLITTATLALILGGTALLAPATPRADDAMPAGMKGEVLAWLKDADSKLQQLAEAMPEAKYKWTPGKGVRTVGEVYMHVASANFGIPALCGVQPPTGFDMETYEKSLTKKADIQKALKASFESMEQGWMGFSDADLEKPVKLPFGPPTTVRGAYFLVLSHCHEHLGQSIAYARMNGVVPPWTAKQQAAMKEGMDKMKADKK